MYIFLYFCICSYLTALLLLSKAKDKQKKTEEQKNEESHAGLLLAAES